MACDADNLSYYLENFSGIRPLDSAICPYVQGGDGLGLGLPLFALLILGPLGLAMSARAQHPGPVIIAGLLVVGSVGAVVAGPAAQVVAVVMLFSIAAFGLYLYQRAQSSL